MNPGMKGTNKLVKKFGDNLVCVRYQYDSINGQRLTTVEIVINRQKWTLDPSRTSPDKIIGLHKTSF